MVGGFVDEDGDEMATAGEIVTYSVIIINDGKV